MTRNFNNQARNNWQSSSHHSSSGRGRGEQPFKPTRPRLNRDTVDRAWENGATRQHADYRPQHNGPRPFTQRPGHFSQGFERPRQPSHENGWGSNRAPSSSSYRGDYRAQREQRPETTGTHRSNQAGRYSSEDQAGSHNQRWNRERTPQQREFNRERNQISRPSRFSQSRAEESQYANYRDERNTRAPRSPQREHENFVRGKRTDISHPRRDNYNPRWQSRPDWQRNSTDTQQERSAYPPSRYPARQRRDYPTPYHASHPTFQEEHRYNQPGGEQFEGDYEHFETQDPVEQERRDNERHVTRLPDGRALKGSRPSQRKQARFWNGVEEETQVLLPHTPAPSEQTQPAEPPVPAAQEVQTAKPARSRKKETVHKVKTVKTAHATETGSKAGRGKAQKKSASGQQGPVIRPSSKGYKWPTPE